MFRSASIFWLILGFCSLLLAESGGITGHVFDKENHQPLAGADIVVNDGINGTTSDSDGSFRLGGIPAGEINITVSFLGYHTVYRTVRLNKGKSVSLEIEMTETSLPSGEIVVSSTRYEKQVKDLAMPFEVVSSRQISNTAPATISDALQNEPSVALARDGIWATHVNIRGMSRRNIVTLVDGNRIETSTSLAAGLSLVDVNDVKRIEVIKGAASSLYGSGALGGVVNIITRQGHYADSPRVSGSFASRYNSVNGGSMGKLALQAAGAKWFARANGTFRSAGDTRTPTGILENSQFRDNSLSAEAGFKPFTDQELRLNYQRFHAEDVGIPGGSVFPQPARVRYPSEEREMYSAEYRFRNLSRSLMNVSVKYFHQLIQRDVENIPNVVQKLYNDTPPKRVTPRKVTPGANHSTDGLQLQSDWYFGSGNHVVAGLDAWQRQYEGHREKYIKVEVLDPADSTRQTVLKTNHIIVGEKPLPNSTYRSIGIYAQDEVHLLPDRLSLTVGGRLDRIQVKNDATRNPDYMITNGARNDNPPDNEMASFPADNAHDISWSSNLGLLCSINSGMDLTLNIARSFRSPNLEERYQYIELGANTYLGDPHLKPEQGYFTDFGVRFYRSNLTFRGNIFLNSLENLVIDQFQEPGLYRKENVGSARIYGFDMNLEYNIYRQAVIYGTAAYVRGEDTGLNRDLPEIPPFNGRVGLRTPLFHLLNLNVRASMFADQSQVAPGEISTPGYTCFDVYLNTRSIETGNFSSRFTFGIENITDKAYRNHLSTYRGFLLAEPGRNIKLGWQMNFN